MNAIATKNWTDYEVRQKVYFVPSKSWLGKERYVTVRKSGRKWVYFSELRNDYKVEKGDNYLRGDDFFTQVGTLYENEEAYQAQVSLQKLYDRLAKVDWRSLTPDQARAVHAIVFGEDLG